MEAKKPFFVIGDSISIQYGFYLRDMIDGVFHCDADAGVLDDSHSPVGVYVHDSNAVLQYLQNHGKEAGRHDVLIFNCGLHDIETDLATRQVRVPLQEYRENLKAILTLARKKEMFPIWANTSPVPDERHKAAIKEFSRLNKDVVAYNESAGSVMAENKVPVIDLYAFSKNLGEDVYFDHVHFKEEIRRLQAAFVAGFLFGFR